MKKFLTSLDHAPLYWIAVGLGLLVFGLNRPLLPPAWEMEPAEQEMLDQAFVEVLRTGERSYELFPGTPQTYGAHVLPQILTAMVSTVTGDAARAGIWLSLVGVVGTFAGLYALAIRVYPLRGFALASVVSAGALGSFHQAISPYPTVALGMALVVWGMTFFLRAVLEDSPQYIFSSAMCIGLAGYLRFELSVLWIFLAIYLVVRSFAQTGKRKKSPSAPAMAACGVLLVLIVLWPMIHRNVRIAGTPLLPGSDAELILGAPRLPGEQLATTFVDRLMLGLEQLTFSPEGPGVFVGILWPLGMLVCLVAGRHKRLPYFWVPVVLGFFLLLTALSWVTGEQSYVENLSILSPLLFPFALVPLAYVIDQVLAHKPQSPAFCRGVWAGAGMLFFLLLQVPLLFQASSASESDSQVVEGVAGFSELPGPVQSEVLVSDAPGAFVRAGKRNVIGLRGQTDWSIITTLTAYGEVQADAFLDYLRNNEVKLLHLSDPEDPLVDRLELEAGAPDFRMLSTLPPPQRLFLISWP